MTEVMTCLRRAVELGASDLFLAAGGPASLDWPAWLSLLACFHFGYHREHHDRPDLAWFETFPAVGDRQTHHMSENSCQETAHPLDT